MKDFKDRVNSIKDRQNQLAREYQDLMAEFEANDALRENETLRREHEAVQQRVAALEARLQLLEKENGSLRHALSEQILDEKLSLIKASRQKLETYFTAMGQGHMNSLDAVEHGARQRIHQLYEQADRFLGADKEVITAKLGQFQDELNHRIAAHRQRVLTEDRTIRSDAAQGYEQLASEGVSEETMQRRMKQNRIEMKIGLNWFNKLGIFLIILAVGAAFQYSYSTWFNGYMKGAAFFLLGALMLAGGEWLFRKNKTVFAMGILGGGISVLYGSVFYSYFLLEIIGLAIGMILSIIITATAVLLSLRYESRTICSFGLVGGYLPFFSYMVAFGLEGSAVYVAMGYLFLLNALILLISFRKNWVVVNYISFLFNMFSMLVLVSIAEHTAVGMLYAVVTFIMYLGITLYVPFKNKTKLTWWDFALLVLNTVINCVTLYSLLLSADWDDFSGLLALLFCATYFALARLSRRHVHQEKETRLFFYGTSLTFSLLVIPFQFGIHYMSLAWLIEGMVLTILGHLYRYRQLERIGWGIVGLCLGIFLFVDSFLSLFDTDSLDYSWKYTFVSLGLIVLTLFYAFRLQDDGDARRYRPGDRSLLSVFKYVALVNFWLYLVYETGRIYKRIMPEGSELYDFYKILLIAAITLILAYAITKVAVLYDTFVKHYVRILYGFGYLACLAVTLTVPSLHADGAYNSAENYVALMILIGFNLLVFFSGRDLIISILEPYPGQREWYPIIAGVYLFGIMTAILGVQLRLGHIGWLFSAVYLLLAIGYITYGFRYKYLLIRRIGLGLTLFSTGKMLLFDLQLMTTGSKIAAYFCFGIVLLGISYIYQKVSNKLGAAEEAASTADSQG
ncbi:DUF2339 domain-containing protein [Fontibacillus sp. BL9]|uniref:DUF2339 domain-containing protein n=1 Tax=Fontibacillus sp. BL9 TaxID=3389971 RepID=UPI00397BC92B